jgi:beta-lactamase superfamily II metal-dependent hydrolase
MRIEVFPSASGDCLLITSSDDKRLLCDAGLPAAYDDFIATPLAELRAQQKPIDVAYVSHIDRDHIGGVLRMLDHEVKWRAFDHMKNKKKKFKKPRMPRPPEVREIWHNAFLEDIAKTESVELGSALTASANALAALNAGGLGDQHLVRQAAEVGMLALSVGDAIEVNWRIGADQLDIPLNRDFDGLLMVARPDRPIQLGSLTITVLGPTAKQLEKLREDWITWLRKSETHLANLRRAHKRDVEDLRSGTPPLDIARLTQEMALAVEKDVTPPNLASLVLLVEENNRRVLLTGDAGDESLLEYFEAAGLMDADGRLEVDVLKVPHHGANNSFSDEFVERVRAANYVFCGDGEHNNPEPDVVEGYLRAVKANPLPNGGTTQFWFNWSASRASKHLALWKEVEGMFKVGSPANVKRRSLGISETRLTLGLAGETN